MAEALAQAGFERVVAGIGDACDFSDGTVDALSVRRQSASGIEATLVDIVFIGDGIPAGVDAGDEDCRIAFDEARQTHAGGADVSDLQKPVLAEGMLNVQIPILRIWQMEVRSDYEQRHGLGELLAERIRSVERI